MSLGLFSIYWPLGHIWKSAYALRWNFRGDALGALALHFISQALSGPSSTWKLINDDHQGRCRIPMRIWVSVLAKRLGERVDLYGGNCGDCVPESTGMAWDIKVQQYVRGRVLVAEEARV